MTARGAPRKRPRAGRVLLLAAGTAAGLGLVEAGLRAVAVLSPAAERVLGEWDPTAVHIEPLGERCYRARPGWGIRWENGSVAHINGRGYRGPEVRIPKPSGTFRVVLLGGSTAHGWGVNDDETIDAHLRRLLARRRPGRAFEVVSLAFDGYDSECDYERLEIEGIRLEPDALILHSGINDAAGARFEKEHPRIGRFEAILARLRAERRRGGLGAWGWIKHRSFAARLAGIARSRLSPRDSPAPLPGPAVPPPHGPDGFEANLRRTAGLTGTKTVVLFSTPPSSLRFPNPPLPPWQGHLIVDPATTQRYRDALDERARRVAADLDALGRRALYVAHDVPVERFLDDCHLDGEGNRLVAADFAAALEPFLAAARGR